MEARSKKTPAGTQLAIRFDPETVRGLEEFRDWCDQQTGPGSKVGTSDVVRRLVARGLVHWMMEVAKEKLPFVREEGGDWRLPLTEEAAQLQVDKVMGWQDCPVGTEET
jgi:hypothetical protein